MHQPIIHPKWNGVRTKHLHLLILHLVVIIPIHPKIVAIIEAMLKYYRTFVELSFSIVSYFFTNWFVDSFLSCIKLITSPNAFEEYLSKSLIAPSLIPYSYFFMDKTFKVKFNIVGFN